MFWLFFCQPKKNSGYQPLTPYQNFHQHLKVYIAALSSWARLGSWALINLLEKQTHAIHAACVMKRFSASFLGEVVLRDSKLSKKNIGKIRLLPFCMQRLCNCLAVFSLWCWTGARRDTRGEPLSQSYSQGGCPLRLPHAKQSYGAAQPA